MPRPSVLLTGATDYIGGLLLPRLRSAGSRVRCLSRRPERLQARVGADVEVVKGDCPPAHALIFRGMLRGIADEAERRAGRLVKPLVTSVL
jgi:nucleoside-diphosphate-sugar epimerase